VRACGEDCGEDKNARARVCLSSSFLSENIVGAKTKVCVQEIDEGTRRTRPLPHPSTSENSTQFFLSFLLLFFFFL